MVEIHYGPTTADGRCTDPDCWCKSDCTAELAVECGELQNEVSRMRNLLSRWVVLSQAFVVVLAQNRLADSYETWNDLLNQSRRAANGQG